MRCGSVSVFPVPVLSRCLSKHLNPQPSPTRPPSSIHLSPLHLPLPLLRLYPHQLCHSLPPTRHSLTLSLFSPFLSLLLLLFLLFLLLLSLSFPLVFPLSPQQSPYYLPRTTPLLERITFQLVIHHY